MIWHEGECQLTPVKKVVSLMKNVIKSEKGLKVNFFGEKSLFPGRKDHILVTDES